jgi:predicted ester cyclase
MGAAQNRAAIAAYVEATNARRPIDWYFAPGYVYHGPTGEMDRDGFMRQHEAFLTAFSNVTMSVLDVVVEEERTATRWQAEGTHTGELMGIPATGRPARITGIIITRFEDGKAAEEWEQIDLLGLMQQIRALPGLP